MIKKNQIRIQTVLFLIPIINYCQLAASTQKIFIDVKNEIKYRKILIEKKILNQDFSASIFGLVDNKGDIFIGDYRTCKIYKFSSNGILIKSVGEKGEGPEEFINPKKLLLSGGKLFVLDYKRPVVQIYNTDLEYLEQRKFPQLFNPLDAVIINESELLCVSMSLTIKYKYRFFIFSFNGDMKNKFEWLEKSGYNGMNENEIIMKYPPILSYDYENNTLSSAEIGSYKINKYKSDFNIEKEFTGNIEFRSKYQEVGAGMFKIKQPLDRSTFLKSLGETIYYSYEFNDETILDVIKNGKIHTRYKSTDINRYLFYINENRFLVSFNENENDISAVGIVRLTTK